MGDFLRDRKKVSTKLKEKGSVNFFLIPETLISVASRIAMLQAQIQCWTPTETPAGYGSVTGLGLFLFTS
ncbi:hypothetical protein [Bacillus haynesii]|uniref:hypothetical protein n=1 Tax=Bacillus haynesii TaxID=1925021 RepID=UPI002281C09C|nr:hypothetical protein [Bacillus haynesii]MCY8554963.1 hypothetical protein [Bacillus haynesii]